MFKLVSTDLFDKSPRCSTRCNKYEASGCDACTLRIRTIFTCDNCGVVRVFYGGNAPNSCSACKRSFPDMYLLKSEYLTMTRIKYHLEK